MKKPLRDYLEIHYCATFFVYSAAFLAFFWELQSLLLRFSLTDILGFFSYQLSFALFESMILSAAVMLLVCLIPLRQVKAHRSVVGGLFIISFAISGLIFKVRREILGLLYSYLSLSQADAQQTFAFLWLFPLLGLPVVSVMIIRSERFVHRFKWFLENLVVLASAYTVIGIIGIMIIVFRNLP
jgi:hypothetical protein